MARGRPKKGFEKNKLELNLVDENIEEEEEDIEEDEDLDSELDFDNHNKFSDEFMNDYEE